MENASDALIIGFSILIFVLALTVAINSFTQAKGISDSILYTSDESNYYEYIESKEPDKHRIVGLETIIPTLYKYYKENYTVVFKQGTYNEETGQISNDTYFPIYKYEGYIENNKKNWSTSYYHDLNTNVLVYNKYGENGYNFVKNGEIFSFDIDEETMRYEPWTGSYDKIKNNLDCFLKGEIYKDPKNNSDYINYSTILSGGFIKWCNTKNAKFVETIKNYYYGNTESSEDTYTTSISETQNNTNNKTKRMIIFTYIQN